MGGKEVVISRREVLRGGVCCAAGVFAGLGLSSCGGPGASSTRARGAQMRFGLVTYLWGQDWDLPMLIGNCEKAEVLGVELRTEHAHKVEANLTASERKEVKKRFADSAVTLVGLGTNFEFHNVNQAEVRKNIEGAKEYIVLSHDVGGSGVKVKPNDLPAERPVEETIEQIGVSLNELGRFGAGYGQQVRVEVHGPKTQELPVMKRIMDAADHPNVTVCWNSNDGDLGGEGLEYNFNLVKGRLGGTVHVRELNMWGYPYQQLIDLFVAMGYGGWIMLEASSKPADRVAALAEQRGLFEELVRKAGGVA